MKHLEDCLKAVPGDIVVVHCSMMGLRRVVKSPWALLQIVLSAFEDRTLVMPAYTSAVAKTGQWHPRLPPDTGSLAMAFLDHDGVLRTESPLNSYLTTRFFARGEGPAWGRHNFMGQLVHQNATFVALGVSFLKSCSYWHFAEHEMRVPYRYYKEFKAAMPDGREISDLMFVGPKKVPQIFWAEPADKLLRKWGYKTDRKYFSHAPMRAIVASGLECLDKNPYSLLKNADEVRKYVESGGIVEENSAQVA